MASVQDGNRELTAWIEEYRRLIAEAVERVAAGHLLPALASLAAIPAVHKRITEQCLHRLEALGENSERDQPVGQYL